VSLFEAKNDEERLIIAAAIACERENCRRVDVIEVERDVVERYGRVDQTPEKGTTPVPEANRLHCSLDWDAATLTRMAEELFDAVVAPREIDSNAIRETVMSLDADTIIGEGAQNFVRGEQERGRRA